MDETTDTLEALKQYNEALKTSELAANLSTRPPPPLAPTRLPARARASAARRGCGRTALGCTAP